MGDDGIAAYEEGEEEKKKKKGGRGIEKQYINI